MHDIDLAAGFDAELPAEWESWLRHRRAEPPSEKEVPQLLLLAEASFLKYYNRDFCSSSEF